MTVRKQQHEKVRILLKNAVADLCRQGLGNTAGFSIEALIGITLEDGEVMLISINETINDDNKSSGLVNCPDDDMLPSRGQDHRAWQKKRHLFTHSLNFGGRRKRGKAQRPVADNHHIKTEGHQSGTEPTDTDSRAVKTEDISISKDNGKEALDGEKCSSSSKKCLDTGITKNILLTNSNDLEDITQCTDKPADCATESRDSTRTPADCTTQPADCTADPADMTFPHVGPYKCSKCGVVYKYRKCLIEHHMKAHQNPGEKAPEVRDWPCQECNRVFPSKRSLTRHIVIHSDNHQQHQCHICTKVFSCKRHVQFHINTVHHGHYPFICDLCGKQVTTKAALEGHMASKHLVNRVKCEKCKRKFARPAALASHVCIEKPARFEETVCRICKKSFDLPKRLIQHMAKHSEPRFQCEQCGRNFRWASSLQAHKAAAHSPDATAVLAEQQQQQNQQQQHQLQQQPHPQQQSNEEQPSYSTESKTIISNTLLTSLPVQTKELHSIVALNDLPAFAALDSTHHPQLNNQIMESSHLMSAMSSLPVKVHSQPAAEPSFTPPHIEHATEVTSAGGQFYLPGLPSSTDISQVHAAWQASLLNQTNSITGSQIEPPAQ